MIPPRIPAVAAGFILSCMPVSAGGLPDGFVHLSDVAPTVRQEMRYFGSLNFLGRRAAGYEAAECILTAPAAAPLAKAQAGLEADGLTLVVFDCYRPMAAVNDTGNPASRNAPYTTTDGSFEGRCAAEDSAQPRASAAASDCQMR